MVFGTVLRSHAGGYLVFEQDRDAVFQCQARGRLKKERVSIVTGDRVELDELDHEKKTAVICQRLDRENLLSRPPLANIDQVIIVQAVHQPDFSSLLCDRYLVYFQLALSPLRPVLCFNKCDLADESELDALRSIYEPLGYFVIIASAKVGTGLADLARIMTGKVSVLTGQSGVGKSTLLNKLEPTLDLKTAQMNREKGVGRHTTTYSELYRLALSRFREGSLSAGQDHKQDQMQDQMRAHTQDHAQDQASSQSRDQTSDRLASWVADTPGFNLLDISHPQPTEVVWQYAEILELAEQCRFIDCLHLVEEGCNVLANLDKIALARYSSYAAIVADAQAEERAQRDSSQKVETAVKSVGGKHGRAKQLPKLSSRYRTSSRRRDRQQVETLTEEERTDSIDSSDTLDFDADSGDDA